MTGPVILVCLYSGVLVAVAYGFDVMARRTAVRAQNWRTGDFRYHSGHDAWTCPQDQWLWPTSYDPEQRIVRYRAKPAVCNSCPVKKTCTTSAFGREITREIDPWPYSEAGRFHRGIACLVALIAILFPAFMLLGASSGTDVVLLSVTAIAAAGLSVPLMRHLWRSPSGFPEHIPQSSGYEIPADRYATRWNAWERSEASGRVPRGESS